MKLAIKKQNLVTMIAIVAIAFSGGIMVGAWGTPHNSVSINVPPTTDSQTSAPITPNTGSPISTTGPTTTNNAKWDGLTPIDSNWVNTILSQELKTSSGSDRKLDPNKPILIVAYWCPFCHQTLQLLNANHLITDKLQVVAIKFDSGEGTTAPQEVNSVGKAEQLFQSTLSSLKVSIPQSSILYGLPNSQIDQLVSGVPTFLIQHDGQWYMQNGFSPDTKMWKAVLS